MWLKQPNRIDFTLFLPPNKNVKLINHEKGKDDLSVLIRSYIIRWNYVSYGNCNCRHFLVNVWEKLVFFASLKANWFLLQNSSFTAFPSFSGFCCRKVDLSSAQWSLWSSAGSDLSTRRQLENNSTVCVSHTPPLTYLLPSHCRTACIFLFFSSPLLNYTPSLFIFFSLSKVLCSFISFIFPFDCVSLLPCGWVVFCQLEKSLALVQCSCLLCLSASPKWKKRWQNVATWWSIV